LRRRNRRIRPAERKADKLILFCPPSEEWPECNSVEAGV